MIKTVIISDADMDLMLSALSDDSVITSLLENIMAGARNEWIKLAGARLNSSRRDYINGIQEVVVGKRTASITLLGEMPNNIEHGMSAYDMHSTLLGPNVPVVPWGSGLKGKHARKDGGYYRAIPFRHQVPGTIGQGGGAPMGTQYKGLLGQEAANALGAKIHSAAKQLAASRGMPGQPTKWGGRLPDGLAPKLKAHHSTDIYSGMVKMKKMYAAADQSTYMTFRMISDGAPEKWHHPGIEAVHLADEVEKYVDKIAPLAFAALVK